MLELGIEGFQAQLMNKAFSGTFENNFETKDSGIFVKIVPEAPALTEDVYLNVIILKCLLIISNGIFQNYILTKEPYIFERIRPKKLILI